MGVVTKPRSRGVDPLISCILRGSCNRACFCQEQSATFSRIPPVRIWFLKGLRCSALPAGQRYGQIASVWGYYMDLAQMLGLQTNIAAPELHQNHMERKPCRNQNMAETLLGERARLFRKNEKARFHVPREKPLPNLCKYEIQKMLPHP